MKPEDFQIFSAHMDTLKEMSKDTSQKPVQYMTERTDKAVNFDLVKRSYTNSLGLSEETASSCDTLLFLPNGTLMIEFKNGKIETSKVKTKIRDSLLLYGDITGKSIAGIRSSVDFILVYNASKNALQCNSSVSSKNSIVNHVTKRAKTELIRFDLERFQTLYFRTVHTYTPKEFECFLIENGFPPPADAT